MLRHAGEIANQENDSVAEILKVFQLAEQHSVTEMQVGSGGIKAGLRTQRLPAFERFLQLRAQVGFPNDFCRAFF